MVEERTRGEGGRSKEDVLVDLVLDVFTKVRKIETKGEDLEQEVYTLRDQDKKRTRELKNHEDEILKHRKEIKRQKDDLKNQRSDQIQYLGLFVAIFTAISVDIQLLKFAQNIWSIVGLILMINTAPLFFFWLIKSFLDWNYIVDTLEDVINDNSYKNIKNLFWHKLTSFFLFFFIIFSVSAFLIYLGQK